MWRVEQIIYPGDHPTLGNPKVFPMGDNAYVVGRSLWLAAILFACLLIILKGPKR